VIFVLTGVPLVCSPVAYSVEVAPTMFSLRLPDLLEQLLCLEPFELDEVTQHTALFQFMAQPAERGL